MKPTAESMARAAVNDKREKLCKDLAMQYRQLWAGAETMPNEWFSALHEAETKAVALGCKLRVHHSCPGAIAVSLSPMKEEKGI